MSRFSDRPKFRTDNIEKHNAGALKSLDAALAPAAAETGRKLDAYFDHHDGKPAPLGWADVELLHVEFQKRKVDPVDPNDPGKTLTRAEQLERVLDKGNTSTIAYDPALTAAFGPAREKGLLAQQDSDATGAEIWKGSRGKFGGEIKQLRKEGHDIPDITGCEVHHLAFTKPEYPQHLVNPEMLRLCRPEKLPGVGSEEDAHTQFHQIDGVEWNPDGEMACGHIDDPAMEQVMRARAFRATSDKVPLQEVAKAIRRSEAEYGDKLGYDEKHFERTVALDTETTGFSPAKGDKIVEIGAVELLNGVASGRIFHTILGPERHIPSQSAKLHGIDDAKVAGMPTFNEKAEDLVVFLGDSKVIAHNAKFDMRFVNSELENAGLPAIDPARVVDTLPMARELHPGEKNSLDALCGRYDVYNRRDRADSMHGALTDAKILADLYGKLEEATKSGRQLDEEGR
jgi:DNA polymerase III subunit epsilon